MIPLLNGGIKGIHVNVKNMAMGNHFSPPVYRLPSKTRKRFYRYLKQIWQGYVKYDTVLAVSQ